MLARCGEVMLPPPGGDIIGRRRLETHFLAFEQLGATVVATDRLEFPGAAPQGRRRLCRRAKRDGRGKRLDGRCGRARHHSKIKEFDEADDIFSKLRPRREIIQGNSLSANVDV